MYNQPIFKSGLNRENPSIHQIYRVNVILWVICSVNGKKKNLQCNRAKLTTELRELDFHMRGCQFIELEFSLTPFWQDLRNTVESWILHSLDFNILQWRICKIHDFFLHSQDIKRFNMEALKCTLWKKSVIIVML